MKWLLALPLLCATVTLAQTTEKPAKPTQPELFAVKYVFGAPWEPGELRTCSTYSNHPNFLLCDEDIRTAVAVGWTDHKKIDPERLLTMTIPDGKRFLVQFSQLPWRLAPPDPDKPTDEPTPVFAEPDGRSRDMESQWDCSKEKTITCKFLKSF
jgi:hypothetical protein